MIYYIKDYALRPTRLSNSKWIWFANYYYTWAPPIYGPHDISSNLNLLEDAILYWMSLPDNIESDKLFDNWIKVRISSEEYTFLRLAGKAILQDEWYLT